MIADRKVIVNIASQRARELSRGSAPMVQVKPNQNYLDTALLEIAEGKLVLDNSDS